MCGRARCSLAREAVAAAACVPDARWRDGGHYRPSYNCSPGAWLPVICLGPDGVRELRTMKWGLVPSFTRLAPGERPDHYRMFNARCESLAEKPVFSRLLPRRRCVAVLEGFYEWLSQGTGRKQPYHMSTAEYPERPAMYLAGLYDVYKDPNGEPVHTFTIVTTDSSKQLAWLHDRMPAILTTPQEVAEWLGERPTTTPGGPEPTHIHPTPTLTASTATASGNSPPRGQDPLQEAAGPAQEAPGEGLGISVSTVQGHDSAGGGGSGRGGAHPRDSTNSGRQRAGGEGGRTVTVDIDLTQTSDEEEEGSGPRGGGGGKKQPRGSHDDDGARRHGGKRHQGGEEGARGNCAALVERLCRPYGGPLLRWHPVTPEMSKPGYDKPDACQDVRTKKGSIASFFKPLVKAGASSPTAVGQSPPAIANASAKIKKDPFKIEPSRSPGPSLGAAASGPLGTPGGAPGARRLAVKEEVLGTKQEKAEVREALNPDECAAAGGGGDAEGAEGMGGVGRDGLEKGEGGAVEGVAVGRKRRAEGAVGGGQGVNVKKEKR